MPSNTARAPLPPAYEPSSVEDRIYEMWESRGYFKPRAGGDPYCIIMPPPNVTGELHLGHGLEDAITDTLVRWHRMRGDTTLWLPGEDHAGIATQNVIERELGKEGLTRQEVGREAFVERTWMWVREYRQPDFDQHRKLGASADWTRSMFTLDPGIVKAVRKTFVDMYNDGLIYRGLRMINWCPRCETALSDLEVDYVEVPSKLYYLRYPVVGEGGMPLPDYVVVATTRPETMVADTGVAVNPDDPRYDEKIGRMLMLPIIGREIPVVADEAVKTEFGTGAVKVTPGHDPNDWEIGQRHGLDVIVALDQPGADERRGRSVRWDDSPMTRATPSSRTSKTRASSTTSRTTCTASVFVAGARPSFSRCRASSGGSMSTRSSSRGSRWRARWAMWFATGE